jgi:hypothetical protein
MLLAVAVFGPACISASSTKTSSPGTNSRRVANEPQQLEDQYRMLASEGDENLVLNAMHLGVAAFAVGDYRMASEAFDRAIERIEIVYANDERAQQARSVWYEEGCKDFKGEPYERCMAYYYRGLLYLREADYQNARACFRNIVINDSLAEEEQYRCDFALGYFLYGWASQCLGDVSKAVESYEEVKRLRPDFVPPAADDNALVLVELGTAPRKVRDGMGHQKLVFRRGKGSTDRRCRIQVLGETVTAYPMEDIFVQAATRGGRAIDHILEHKLAFRDGQVESGHILSDVSKVAVLETGALTQAGVVASGAIGISGAIGVVGGVEMLIASNAKPQADIRYWDNLPESVHVMTVKADSGEQLAFTFLGEHDEPVPELTTKSAPLTMSGRDKAYAVVWVRSR